MGMKSRTKMCRKEAPRKVIATQLADQPTRRAALRRSGRHHTDALLVDLYAGMLARSTIASDIGSVHRFSLSSGIQKMTQHWLHVMEVM
jgi:hypothetical protein